MFFQICPEWKRFEEHCPRWCQIHAACPASLRRASEAFTVILCTFQYHNMPSKQLASVKLICYNEIWFPECSACPSIGHSLNYLTNDPSMHFFIIIITDENICNMPSCLYLLVILTCIFFLNRCTRSVYCRCKDFRLENTSWNVFDIFMLDICYCE